MKNKFSDPTTAFQQALKHVPEWALVQELISRACSGKTYLVGGAVCRAIAHVWHNTPLPKHDWDVIAEKVNTTKAGAGWQLGVNKFGNPKLARGKTEVDIMPLNNIRSILRRKLEPNIENYLSGTPVTVQAVAYDLQTKQIIGDIGINALREGTVAVNNAEELACEAERKKITPDALLKKKAESMGFRAIEQ